MAKKSVEWHKEKLLARLSPKDKKYRAYITQWALPANCRTSRDQGDFKVFLEIRKKMRDGQEKTVKVYPLIAEGHKRIGVTSVTRMCRVIQALDTLVAEDKVIATLTNKEWYAQIALGVARTRTIRPRAV